MECYKCLILWDDIHIDFLTALCSLELPFEFKESNYDKRDITS